MATVTLTTFNTIQLPAGTVTTLVTSVARPAPQVYYNILNLGPSTVYFRANADPSATDPQSETLPAGLADNGVLVPDGTVGLRFLAAAATSLTIRVVPGLVSLG